MEARNFHGHQRLGTFALHDAKSLLDMEVSYMADKYRHIMYHLWYNCYDLAVYYCLFIYHCIQTRSLMWHKMIINDLSEYVGALSRFELPPVVTLWLWPLCPFPPQWYYCALLVWLSHIFHWYDGLMWLIFQGGIDFKLGKLFFSHDGTLPKL